MHQRGVANGRMIEIQTLYSRETPDLCHDCIRCRGGHMVQAGSGDVTEIVDSDEIDEPSWRPGFASRQRFPVVPLPVIPDRAASLFNRRHRIVLDVGLADHPSQCSPEDDHKDDQPPHAEPQVATPGTSNGATSHVMSAPWTAGRDWPAQRRYSARLIGRLAGETGLLHL